MCLNINMQVYEYLLKPLQQLLIKSIDLQVYIIGLNKNKAPGPSIIFAIA